MARVACVLLVLVCGASARAADLPPGAIARLGDDRFRAGGEIEHLALSPDGKQFATVAWVTKGVQLLAVWDATTGRPVREYKVNRQLFKGFVWAEGRTFAIALRAEPATKGTRAKVVPDDFRVWDFTKSAPPLLPQDTVGIGSPTWWVDADWPRGGAEYTQFRFSADGARVAALWESGTGKHAIHVFELEEADSAAKLRRVGTLDLGAEGAAAFSVAADGKSLVTFRALGTDDMTATTWDVASGKPAKPVRVPHTDFPMTEPDARALVTFVEDGSEWGFDRYDLATGNRRKLARWERPADHGVSCSGGAFTPSGRELIVQVYSDARSTYVIDLATGRERGRVAGHAPGIGEGAGNHTAVSPDGRVIATADVHGLVRLWDAKTLRALTDAPGHRAMVRHTQLSPDGTRLLTRAEDHTFRLWDVATGKELRAFAGATDNGPPLFSPDGTAVLYHANNKLIARDLQTGLLVPLPRNAAELKPREAKRATAHMSAVASRDFSTAQLFESGSNELRRTLTGHRGSTEVIGFTTDGTKLLTAGGDHTVLVWDMRLAHVPLPDALKKETDAAKLWKALASGKADAAYLAMARLAREPAAAVALARLKLTPAKKGDAATEIADARAIELLEALDTADARGLLKELASGHADAFRTREAGRALMRLRVTEYNPKGK